MKKIKNIFQKVFDFISQMIPDILAVLGALLISYGAYLIIKPAGFIVLGIMLISSAVILSKAR